jgi:predicted transcriptional regulator
LIRSTRDALTAEQAEVPQAAPETVTPAVSVRKSLSSREHIISLIDGKPYKTLKRHLKARGLTPNEYRSRHNLPASYPMVAPAYAEHRRTVARRIGLGSRKGAAGDSPSSTDDQLDAVAPVDLQGAVPQAAPEAEKKPRRATAAEKIADAAAGKVGEPRDEASSAGASDMTLANQVDRSSGAPPPADAQIAQSEVTAPSTAPAKPAAKARSTKSAGPKAPETGRGRKKAKAASGSAPETEAAREAPGVEADDEQIEQAPAQTPKRRAKLSVFKKSGA